MGKVLKNVWKSGLKSELSFVLSLIAGAWTVGMILVWCIVKFAHESTYAHLGALMALIVYCSMSVVYLTMLEQTFNLAVSMGVPRRRYIPAYFMTLAGYALIETAAVYVFSFAESVIARRLYPGMVCEFDILGFYQSEGGFRIEWWVMLLAALLFPLLRMFLGSICMRFGIKWIVPSSIAACFVFVMSALGGRDTSTAGKALLGIWNFLRGIPAGLKAAALLAAAVSAAAVTYRLLSRQRVTF